MGRLEQIKKAETLTKLSTSAKEVSEDPKLFRFNIGYGTVKTNYSTSQKTAHFSVEESEEGQALLKKFLEDYSSLYKRLAEKALSNAMNAE